MLWELPPEIVWLKLYLCYLIYKHIYCKSQKGTLEREALFGKQSHGSCIRSAAQETTGVALRVSASKHPLQVLAHIEKLREGKNLLQNKLCSQDYSPETEDNIIFQGPQSHLWANVCHLNVCQVLRYDEKMINPQTRSAWKTYSLQNDFLS